MTQVRTIPVEGAADGSESVSDERFRLLARATNDVVRDWDLATDAVWWSEALTAAYGHPREGIEPGLESWTSRIHPEDVVRVKASMKGAIEDGSSTWRAQYRFRRRDGAYVDVLDRAHIARDASGKAVRMVGAMMDVSERARTERELQRVRHDLELILHSAGEGVYGVDTEGATTFMNAAALRMLGLTEREAIGHKLHDVIHHARPDGSPYPAPECPIHQAAQGGPGASVKGELFFAKKGTAIPVDYVTAPIRDGARVVGAVTVFKDVTERLRAEQELREKSERLRAAIEASSTGTFRWDVATNALDWDENLGRLFGLAPGGTPRHIDQFTALVHADDRPALFAALERCIREGADLELEFRAIWPDGTVRWLLDRGQMIRDAQGRALYMTGACTDITLRKRVEEDLRAQTNMLAWQRRVLENAAKGAPLHETLDTLCREAHQNAPDHHFTVLLADEVAGVLRHGAAPTLPDEYNKAVDGIRIGEGVGSCGTAAFRKASVLVTDIEADPLWKDFKALALPLGLRSCWSTPILSRDGSLLGTWAVYRTTPGEPEPRDAELVAVATRLAAMVIERARAEKQLRERADELARMTDALQRSNRELDQFAYITSHDLKAPLRGIANLSRWIEEDSAESLSADSRQHLELLRGRVNRMEGLIDAILEYSRVGRVRAKPERVAVDQLVADAVDLLAPPEGFRVEVQGSLPTVTAERMRLQQVFMNLIGNAVKHHHDKPRGLVTIRAEDAGSRWRFVVSDNGPGIAPRFHEKVFVIFQTLEARDKVEGAGIGLALVKKIVESNGGTVALDSDVGRGASFSFTWPK